MVYLFGVLGLLSGFALGLWVISVMLPHVSKGDFQTKKSLWWTYGLMVWIFAGGGCWLGVFLHRFYF